jgi:tight adherence protein B
MMPQIELPGSIAGVPLTTLLRFLAVGVVALALFLGAWGAVADTGGPLARLWRRYVSWLDRKLRLMFVFYPGERIAVTQAIALAFYPPVAMYMDLPMWGLGIVAICGAPFYWIEQERRKRLIAIELQLDGFLLALANALKSTPSIGSAFASVIPVVAEPMRSEAEMATKEMKVGSTLDQALLHMAARIGSRSVDTALSAILIGRKVGGNLPKVLESTSTSLREMQRLDGVLRTKTADGRMQMWFIGAMPFVIVVVLSFLWPSYLDPLTQSFVGYVLSAVIISSWLVSLVLARKILSVDL